jgi:hypothetical protein
MIKSLCILTTSAALAMMPGAAKRRAAPATVPSSAAPCRGADDYTNNVRESILIVSRSNEAWADSLRARSHVPAVSDTAISVVSDSTKCAAALTVYNAHARIGVPIATDIYLLRAGPVFVASNPNDGTDRDFTDQIVLDSALAYIGRFLR